MHSPWVGAARAEHLAEKVWPLVREVNLEKRDQQLRKLVLHKWRFVRLAARTTKESTRKGHAVAFRGSETLQALN